MSVRLALCQDLLAQSCLSGFSLIRFVCFLVQQQHMLEHTHVQRRAIAIAIAILCFHSRLLGVLAMIDDDATDWKV